MTQEDEIKAARRDSVARTLEAYKANERGRGGLSAAASRASGVSTCGQCSDAVTFQHNGATYAIDEDSFPVRLPMDRWELEAAYARVQAYKKAQQQNENGQTPAPGLPV